MGIRRWAVVGADYVWPRRTMGAIRHFASLAGIEIVHEETVPTATVTSGQSWAA